MILARKDGNRLVNVTSPRGRPHPTCHPPALRPLLTVIVTTALARDLTLTAMGDALHVVVSG